jgi:glycosyltransferase involved in cell wall biosynthesis
MTVAQKARVALVVLNDSSGGGAHGYEGGVISALTSKKDSTFDFLIYAPKKLNVATKKRFPHLEVCSYQSGLFTMIFLSIRNSLQGYKILKAVGLRYGKLERSFVRNRISLAYFLTPNALALDLVDTPMINTLWDLGHRDIPEFVEISGDRHFEERELFYRQILPKSFRVIVDTERTSLRIQQCYGVLSERVLVGGIGATKLDVAGQSTSHPGNFFLYPAQFWPHKRHVLLLKAFQIVCEQEADCKLVLTGSDKGNLRHVMKVAKELNLDTKVEFRGFVATSELAVLIRDARCLVFPSQLGPSNMPPLEAAMLGTPSLISNVHADPLLEHPLIKTVQSQEPEDWAFEMLRVWRGPKPSVQVLTYSNLHFLEEISKTLNEFEARRSEWASIRDRRFKRTD